MATCYHLGINRSCRRDAGSTRGVPAPSVGIHGVVGFVHRAPGGPARPGLPPSEEAHHERAGGTPSFRPRRGRRGPRAGFSGHGRVLRPVLPPCPHRGPRAAPTRGPPRDRAEPPGAGAAAAARGDTGAVVHAHRGDARLGDGQHRGAGGQRRPSVHRRLPHRGHRAPGPGDPTPGAPPAPGGPGAGRGHDGAGRRGRRGVLGTPRGRTPRRPASCRSARRPAAGRARRRGGRGGPTGRR